MNILKTYDKVTKNGYRNIVLEVEITDEDIAKIIDSNKRYHIRSISADHDASKVEMYISLTEGVS